SSDLVVGDYVVLDSDIDKTYLEIKSRGVNIEGIKRCELLGMLLEDKFYAHHAVQDSVPVNDEEVRAIMENNIEYLVKNLGSMSKVLEYYRKKSEDDFRAELEEITRTNKLTEGMKRKLTDEVEITPEERSE